MRPEVSEYYRDLDLQPGATLGAVRDAYRQLVKVWHPDRFGHDPKLQAAANSKLKRINSAYEAIVAFIENGGGVDASPEPASETKAPRGPMVENVYRLGVDRYYARDYKHALDFFLKAAEMGSTSAEYAVGFILYQHTTRNVFTIHKQVKNDNAAFEWFSKAAEHGHVKAQYMLGLLNLYAYCAPYNEREARRWLQRAADQGFTAARERLSRTTLFHKVRAVPLAKWIMEPPPAAPFPD